MPKSRLEQHTREHFPKEGNKDAEIVKRPVILPRNATRKEQEQEVRIRIEFDQQNLEQEQNNRDKRRENANHVKDTYKFVFSTI